jgi:hypothetical protein
MDGRRYCSAVFLDIGHILDKVWHTRLLYKLKLHLPHTIYSIFKSYLADRHFYVKLHDARTTLYPILSGVPQGSVLGPIVLFIYKADIPTTRVTEMATFADDTAILASHVDPISASRNLQILLGNLQTWFRKWKLKGNEIKSVHVTFTLNRDVCPAVTLNGVTIPQADDTKYLGMHLDKRLTWRKHIFTKRKQLELKIQANVLVTWSKL